MSNFTGIFNRQNEWSTLFFTLEDKSLHVNWHKLNKKIIPTTKIIMYTGCLISAE